MLKRMYFPNRYFSDPWVLLNKLGAEIALLVQCKIPHLIIDSNFLYVSIEQELMIILLSKALGVGQLNDMI